MTPRGGADRIDGVADGVLRVRVAPAPADGAANASLVRVLAATLGVPPSSVRIVSGATARRKLLEVDGIDRAALRSRWPDLDV